VRADDEFGRSSKPLREKAQNHRINRDGGDRRLLAVTAPLWVPSTPLSALPLSLQVALRITWPDSWAQGQGGRSRSRRGSLAAATNTGGGCTFLRAGSTSVRAALPSFFLFLSHTLTHPIRRG
jgi:hypothetical protein